jgi:hypothetical protein
VEDFELMRNSASAEQIESWTAIAIQADENRLEDISAMDIYKIALPKGLSFDEVVSSAIIQVF